MRMKDAVTPNFLIQEQIDQRLGAGLLTEKWQVKDSYTELPTKLGLLHPFPAGIHADLLRVSQI
jgi:hypothetical protein